MNSECCAVTLAVERPVTPPAGPYSQAIVAGAEKRALTLPPSSNFESLTGKGVTGIVDGRKVALGNAALMERA